MGSPASHRCLDGATPLPGLLWPIAAQDRGWFTLAEHTVLAVVAAEVAEKRECTLTLECIVAVVGVCRKTIKNAFRQAESLGLLRIEVRWLTNWRNAPNRVTILPAGVAVLARTAATGRG